MSDGPAPLTVGEHFADPNREAVGLQPIWTGAGGGGGGGVAPVITAVRPDTCLMAELPRYFEVDGDSFQPDAVVAVDGVDIPSSMYGDSGTMVVTAFSVAAPGVYQITVRNGSAHSNALPLTVTATTATTTDKE